MFYGVDVKDAMSIKGKKNYGVSVAIVKGDVAEERLYPVCGNVFGRAGRIAGFKFGKNSCTLDGAVCKKL